MPERRLTLVSCPWIKEEFECVAPSSPVTCACSCRARASGALRADPAACAAAQQAPPAAAAADAGAAEARVHDRRRAPAHSDQARSDGRLRGADREAEGRRPQDRRRSRQEADGRASRCTRPPKTMRRQRALRHPLRSDHKDVEYELFAVLQKVLTPDELRDAAGSRCRRRPRRLRAGLQQAQSDAARRRM